MTKLIKEEIENLNNPISTDTLMDLNVPTEKTPGVNGFTSDFYPIMKEEIIFLHCIPEMRKRRNTPYHLLHKARKTLV